MDKIHIIYGALALVVVYSLYRWVVWMFGDDTKANLIAKTTNLDIFATDQGAHKITDDDLSKGSTMDYTYSIWIYVNEWVAGEKYIFKRTNSVAAGDAVITSMKFENNTNDVIVSLGTMATTGTTGGAVTAVVPSVTEEVKLENVPIQTWVNITVTINNRAVDVYLDGKLVKTKVLENVPILPVNGEFKIGGGKLMGYISNFQYFGRAVDPREAYAIYREGPGGSNWFDNILSKYKIKLSFLNNNIEVAELGF